MAEWNREKVNPSDLNNGNEWEQGDRVARQELNAMVNAGLYAQDFAEHLADTPDTSEANNVGTPSVGFVDNPSATTEKPYKRLKFSNLKGEKGEQGEQGIQGEKGDKGDKGDTGTSITNATAGTPTTSGDITTTPITFTFSDLTTKTVNVSAQKGEKGDTGTIPVDDEFSTTSTNPLQNNVVTNKFTNIENTKLDKTPTLLWEGSANSINATIMLPQSISSFTFIYFTATNESGEMYSQMVLSSDLLQTNNSNFYNIAASHSNVPRYINLYQNGHATLTIIGVENLTLNKVYGI